MELQVVAAAIVVDNRLLTVSKAGAARVFYLPGGKPALGETKAETLARELAEELQTQPLDVQPYLVVHSQAALEGVPMCMTVYRCRLARPARLGAELVDLRWVTSTGLTAPDVLAPALSDVLVPQLHQDGLIH